MQISASMVKELRDRTGAGMMDCKKALGETSGDFEAAVDWLRTKGIAKAEKKSGRVASEGMTYAYSTGTKGCLVEVNAETDFVAKNDKFVSFVEVLAKLVAETGTTDVAKINELSWPEGGTVAEKLTDLIATIGENMSIRRAAVLEVSNGAVASYMHMGGKISVLVAITAPSSDEKLADVARNVAMHVAAANPASLDRDSIDQDLVARETAVYKERALESGKPENIVEKIVEGQINKFYEEKCLTEQAFIMDTDQKVGEVVAKSVEGAKISEFARFELGEGIEKKQDDFAAEVASMSA